MHLHTRIAFCSLSQDQVSPIQGQRNVIIEYVSLIRNAHSLRGCFLNFSRLERKGVRGGRRMGRGEARGVERRKQNSSIKIATL